MAILSPRPRSPRVTAALVGASTVVTAAVWLEGRRVLPLLLIGRPGSAFLADILAGELWRLVTPVFVHLGALHLIFNMMWLWDLGGAIERLKGGAFLALFVAASGVASNFAQYAITRSPNFGGMSGVVYALLGYVWMQGRFNPAFGIALHRSTVAMMLAWYALCWTGLLGPIANWAHTGGLVLGVAWGFLDRRPPRARLRA
ncbi:MAG TPA: rhomboid family intramembrane serine protease [Usitatibacter sp.]|nr:rhomboid family intramembrane serine protease [Usitatibacter sp.]